MITVDPANIQGTLIGYADYLLPALSLLLGTQVRSYVFERWL
jgi:hypothetical protein